MEPPLADGCSAAPFWLPDWRQKSEYPEHSADARRLWWEFLRRNRDFRYAWECLRVSPAAAVSGELARPFGLTAMHDPADSTPPAASLLLPRAPAPATIMFEVDCARPLAPQLEDARKRAQGAVAAWRAMQEPIPCRRVHAHRLVEALRVHDALLTGAGLQEVRAHLYPRLNVDSGRRCTKRRAALARRYVDGDYRLLLQRIDSAPLAKAA